MASAITDINAAQAMLDKCKAEDENSCGNVDGCAWFAGKNACGPKCENLGAGPCKDPAFGCNWSSANKCHAPGSLGGQEESQSGDKCSAYSTASSCQAGNGKCAWDTSNNRCFTSCSALSKDACTREVDDQGNPRCVVTPSGKCAAKVIAQCQPLVQSEDEVGVVAGRNYLATTKGDIAMYTIIGMACTAVLVAATPLGGMLKYALGRRGSGADD